MSKEGYLVGIGDVDNVDEDFTEEKDEVGEDLIEVAEEEFINETDDVVEVEEDGWLDSPRQVTDGEEHVVVVVEGGDLDSPRQLKDDVVVEEGYLVSAI